VILLEGPSTISALVLESVIGSSGMIVPPAGYLRGVRDLCTRHGIVYIADEVMVGFGRTGAWFGVDHEGVSPDLLVFAKGVNSGYVPLGGVLVGNPIFETFTKRPLPGGHDLQRAPARLRGRRGRHRRNARRGHRRRSCPPW
jgi:taurine---2-oxoglutarate transaminase